MKREQEGFRLSRIKNIKRFEEILAELRKLPETSNIITAYGSGPEEIDNFYVIGEFVEAIWDEELKNLEDDVVNAYYQLFSIDYQHSYEGIDTFYENLYEDNKFENVIRACKWLKENGYDVLASIIEEGYENEEKREIVSDWINNNTETVYSAYRKLLIIFEDKYL